MYEPIGMNVVKDRFEDESRPVLSDFLGRRELLGQTGGALCTRRLGHTDLRWGRAAPRLYRADAVKSDHSIDQTVGQSISATG